MNKTFALSLILALGAPAAAELAAPELPLIDAAVVRAQPFEKESINIGAAFPGMQACKFAGVQGDTCSFACKDGSTVKRPRLNSSVAQNGGCAMMIMVPAGAPKAAAPTARSAGNKAAPDPAIAMPFERARMNANTLRTIALALPGMQAPRDYADGVAEVSEAVNEILTDMETAIRTVDHFGVYHQAQLMTPQIERLAGLARSIEKDPNYQAWAGPQVFNVAVQLERSIDEVRLNAYFF